MVSSTCEAVGLGFGSPESRLDVQVISNGQSIRATCAATVATYHRTPWRRVANANGKTNADGCVAEVGHAY
jgi:hypothetical protein